MMSFSVNERNSKARELVNEQIRLAKKNPLSRKQILDLKQENSILNSLIPIKAKGFRGIVLTAIIGKYLNPSFDPLNKFYDCKPRAIFENGIKDALDENEIPSGKSDPLNVAKNVNRLDEVWAEGSRPTSAALAVVEFLKLLDQEWKNKIKRDLLIRLFFLRLIQFADSVKVKNVSAAPPDHTLPIVLANKLSIFCIDCPESGSIPQFVISNLIKRIRENDSKYIKVEGTEGSVFATNTTSKKPADVWEIMKDGSYGALYEITVKKIDIKRLNDCIDSLSKLSISSDKIIFICKMPENTLDLLGSNDSIIHKNIGFQFIDIKNFIISSFILLNDDQRVKLFKALQEFVFDVNREEKTKEYWGKHFGEV